MCPKCKGTGKVVCPFCEGYLHTFSDGGVNMTPCYECDSKGEITCQECGGSGDKD